MPRSRERRQAVSREREGPTGDGGNDADATGLRGFIGFDEALDEEDVELPKMRLRAASAQDHGYGTEHVSAALRTQGKQGTERPRTRRDANVEESRDAGRRGVPARTARFERKATSEGTKAQEGEATGHLHKVSEGTDSFTEQSLEGPPPIDTTGRTEAGNGGGNEGRGSAASEKSEEATVAAMRHGCERGDSFGGYETRCGDSATR